MKHLTIVCRFLTGFSLAFRGPNVISPWLMPCDEGTGFKSVFDRVQATAYKMQVKKICQKWKLKTKKMVWKLPWRFTSLYVQTLIGQLL